MSAAFFYHLTQRPLEDTLTMLVGKARGAGWPVIVRGTDRKRLEWLDEKLWLGPEEEFLAHGLSGGAHDAHQPVLLTELSDIPNAAQCLIAIDGADVKTDEVTSLERVCILFDGHNEAAVAQARAQWKALTSEGAPAQYWSEESGRWEKKAEHPA